MNEMRIFENEQFGKVRTVIRDGEPWFVAADVCRALEHSNVSMALERLDADEKAKFNLGLRGGDTGCVNEPGLYSLVLGSRKPEAKAFKRWITHEVIPSIRKTGGYIAGENQMSDDELVARALLMLKKKLEARNLELDQARGEIKQKGRPNPAPGPQGFLLRPGAPGQGGRAHLPDRQRLRPVGPRLKRHAA